MVAVSRHWLKGLDRDRLGSVPKKRLQDTQVNVRMTAAQKARLERATETGLEGLRIPLGPWLLALGLREADTKLGPEPALVIGEDKISPKALRRWAKRKS
jgi:hypothetical protein